MWTSGASCLFPPPPCPRGDLLTQPPAHGSGQGAAGGLSASGAGQCGGKVTGPEGTRGRSAGSGCGWGQPGAGRLQCLRAPQKHPRTASTGHGDSSSAPGGLTPPESPARALRTPCPSQPHLDVRCSGSEVLLDEDDAAQSPASWWSPQTRGSDPCLSADRDARKPTCEQVSPGQETWSKTCSL